MPKYLFHVNYLQSAVLQIAHQEGEPRPQRAAKLAEDVGGTVESFHFAFGGTDAYVITDLPDDESAAAISLAVNASGAVTTQVTKLLTPDQMEAAARKVDT